MPVEMRKFTQAEMLAARFWFLEKPNIKKETIAESIGISVAEIEEILDSEEYHEAVERLILSARTPSKLREWIDIYGDSRLSWFARRMWLSELLLTVLVVGCSSKKLDFTVISTKDLERTIPPESIGERVEGRDEGWVLLGIPFGAPEIKEAIDDALEKAGPASGYNALTDGVLYQTTTFYLVAAKISYKVEGTPVIVRLTETLIPVLDTMPAF